MRKLSLLWASALAATAVFLTSCGEDDPVAPVGPKIATVGTVGTISVQPNTSSTFQVVVSKGDKDLKSLQFRINGSAPDAAKFKVEAKKQSQSNFDAVSAGSYNIASGNETYDIKVTPLVAGSYPLVVSVIDKDDLAAGLSAITVNGESYSIKATTAQLTVGAQNAGPDSYVDDALAVVKQADATTATNIIISYAENGTTPTLVSPVKADREAEIPGVTKGSATTTSTYFGSTSLDFATVTGDDLAAITSSVNKKIAIEKGKSYTFVQGTVKGIIKVVDITMGATNSVASTITIEIKMVNVPIEAVEVK
jgi:hypothetical protein